MRLEFKVVKISFNSKPCKPQLDFSNMKFCLLHKGEKTNTVLSQNYYLLSMKRNIGQRRKNVF